MHIVTNVYDPQFPHDNLSFPNSLQNLNPYTSQSPWIMEGDFNIISSLLENKGGVNRLDQDSDHFKETLNDLHFAYWETNNGIFTWNNHRRGNQQITSFLDHFLVSESLLHLNYAIETSILPFQGFDHWPICITIDIQASPKNQPFRLKHFCRKINPSRRNLKEGGEQQPYLWVPQCIESNSGWRM